MVGHRVDRCGSCQAELSAGASFCPGCGAPTGVLAVDEVARAEGVAGGDAEVVLRSGWKRVAGVVAVLVAVVAAAWLVGRTGGGAERAEPGTPATTATTAASTTVAPSVCDSLPATTGSGLADAAGVTLVLVDDDGYLLRLDLATGTLSCGRPERVGGRSYDHPASLQRVGTGTLIWTERPGEFRYVPDDPAEPVSPLPEDADFVPGPDPGTLWVNGWDEAGEYAQLVDVTQDPWQRSSRLDLPDGADPAGGDGAGRLLLESIGGYYLLSGDGSMERVWEGQGLVAVNAHTVVGVVCDDQAECRLRTEDRTTGERTDLGEALQTFPLFGPWGLSVPELSLSPDGTLLTTTTGPQLDRAWDPLDGPAVWDLRTGAVIRFSTGTFGDPAGSPGGFAAWSADSRFLFWVDYYGVVQVWQRDGPAEAFPLGDGELPPMRGLTTIG